MGELNNNNYFSPESMKEYFSVSQFKSFMQCEARTMAELNGEYKQPTSKALLMGSYVDAYFSDELEGFSAKHPEIYKRDGSLKADYVKCDQMIDRARRDEMFMRYMDGEKQTIMTGELFDEPWKIKMDAYHPGDMIVDLKCMKDIKPIYQQGEWHTFIDAWKYDLQLYVYQQIEAQNSKDGKLLPCYLAVITKEDEPDIEIIEVPQWRLNSMAALVEHYLPYYASIKAGSREPERCEDCAYCKRTKVLTEPKGYDELVEEIVR